MKYEITRTINGESYTINVENGAISDADRATLKNAVNFSAPEERDDKVKKFVDSVNSLLKWSACESIVANYADDMVKGVLSRVTYAKFAYNANKNTLDYFDVAEKGGIPVFVEFSDMLKYIRDYNKNVESDSDKLTISGDFIRKDYALLVIFRHYLLGKLSERDAERVEKITADNPELAKVLKGFCKLRNGESASGTAQQEILDYFYGLFNAKTGKSVKAKVKFESEKGEKITAFDFIRSCLRKTTSVNKTVRDGDENALFNILCNMYITSEQAINFRGKGAKLADAFANFDEKKGVITKNPDGDGLIVVPENAN